MPNLIRKNWGAIKLEHMKKVLYVFMVASMITVVGCREEKTPGEKVDERMEETGESMEDAADEVEDNMEDAADEVEDRVEDATDDN
ncbi:hypothetical protein LCGC14_0665970 [marine sediment metagenome]